MEAAEGMDPVSNDTLEKIRDLAGIGDGALQEVWPMLSNVVHPDVKQKLELALDSFQAIERRANKELEGPEAPYWASTDNWHAGPFKTPQEAFSWIEGQFGIDMSDRRRERCEEVRTKGYSSIGKDEGAIATDEAAIYREDYAEWPRIKTFLDENSTLDTEATS